MMAKCKIVKINLSDSKDEKFISNEEEISLDSYIKTWQEIKAFFITTAC